jgi:serralysin
VINSASTPARQSLQNNGYVYFVNGGLAFLAEYFNFAPFNAAQQAPPARRSRAWDDVIAVTLQETDINAADIAFGNLASAPTTQAYAYPSRTPR